jgi:tubulin-specific chaperone D
LIDLLVPLQSDATDTFVHPRTADVISTFWHRWTEFQEIEIQATILSCVASSSALHSHTADFVDMISEGLDNYTTNARGDIGSLVRIEATKAAGAIWGMPILNEIKLDASKKLFGKVLRAASEKLDRVRIEGQRAVAFALKNPTAIVPNIPSTVKVIRKSTSTFESLSTSSKEYFLFLLKLQTSDQLAYGSLFRDDTVQWAREFMEGYITSADTGSEDLIRASRAALAEFCEIGHTAIVYDSLIRILETRPNEDRAVIPCLEVLSFLFDWGFLQRMDRTFENLNRLVKSAMQRKGKTSIRRLEACVKVFAGLNDPETLEQLASIVMHRFPTIRNAAVDE